MNTIQHSPDQKESPVIDKTDDIKDVKTQIKNLPHHLKSKIYGQDHVIDAVSDHITTSLAGFLDESKPIGSFLFTGSTGVGKTELAKELASYLDLHFERFDMSEYSDEYSARNLTGGQKGLVGYEDGGILTNAIKTNPRSLLLLDEIEKAHPKIYNTFLQVLDYGTLTDTKGYKIDFSKTIIIMTSNLGANEDRGIGFGNQDINRSSAVANFLTPEFRNRLDSILEFNDISNDISKKVIEKYLGEFQESLQKRDIELTISDSAKKLLLNKDFDMKMGARSIQRVINSEFKKHISKEYLFGTLSNGGSVDIDTFEGEFIYNFKSLKTEDKKDIEIIFKDAKYAREYIKEHKNYYIKKARFGNGFVAIKKELS
jgi:ATP-dependent Clp protease ATP-binding subunit ClpA